MEANLPTHHQLHEKGTYQVPTMSGRTVHQEVQNTLKRKTSESDCDLDLNLSLKIRPKDDELDKGLEVRDDQEVHSSLSLSLSSSSSSKLSRLKGGGDHQNEDRKPRKMMMASTLDLTL